MMPLPKSAFDLPLLSLRSVEGITMASVFLDRGGAPLSA